MDYCDDQLSQTSNHVRQIVRQTVRGKRCDLLQPTSTLDRAGWRPWMASPRTSLPMHCQSSPNGRCKMHYHFVMRG